MTNEAEEFEKWFLHNLPDLLIALAGLEKALAEDFAIQQRLVDAAPLLLEACALDWRDNPETHCKEVYTLDGRVIFTSERTGLGGAAEAEGFMHEQRQAAVEAAIEGG